MPPGRRRLRRSRASNSGIWLSGRFGLACRPMLRVPSDRDQKGAAAGIGLHCRNAVSDEAASSRSSVRRRDWRHRGRNQRMADLCLAIVSTASNGSIDCMTRARIAGIPVIEHSLESGEKVDHRTPCCATCVHPAIDHDANGCQVYGSSDECVAPVTRSIRWTSSRSTPDDRLIQTEREVPAPACRHRYRGRGQS